MQTQIQMQIMALIQWSIITIIFTLFFYFQVEMKVITGGKVLKMKIGPWDLS